LAGKAGGWRVVDEEHARAVRKADEDRTKPVLPFTFTDLIPEDTYHGDLMCIELVERLPGERLRDVKWHWPLGEVYETVYVLRAQALVRDEQMELDGRWRDAKAEEKKRPKTDRYGEPIVYEDPDEVPDDIEE
jgi:hypothetical protein